MKNRKHDPNENDEERFDEGGITEEPSAFGIAVAEDGSLVAIGGNLDNLIYPMLDAIFTYWDSRCSDDDEEDDGWFSNCDVNPSLLDDDAIDEFADLVESQDLTWLLWVYSMNHGWFDRGEHDPVYTLLFGHNDDTGYNFKVCEVPYGNTLLTPCFVSKEVANDALNDVVLPFMVENEDYDICLF